MSETFEKKSREVLDINGKRRWTFLTSDFGATTWSAIIGKRTRTVDYSKCRGPAGRAHACPPRVFCTKGRDLPDGCGPDGAGRWNKLDGGHGEVCDGDATGIHGHRTGRRGIHIIRHSGRVLHAVDRTCATEILRHRNRRAPLPDGWNANGLFALVAIPGQNDGPGHASHLGERDERGPICERRDVHALSIIRILFSLRHEDAIFLSAMWDLASSLFDLHNARSNGSRFSRLVSGTRRRTP